MNIYIYVYFGKATSYKSLHVFNCKNERKAQRHKSKIHHNEEKYSFKANHYYTVALNFTKTSVFITWYPSVTSGKQLVQYFHSIDLLYFPYTEATGIMS